MSGSAADVEAIASAVAAKLTPTTVQASAPAVAPSSAFLGGYGYHLTHMVSEFTILAGMLGGLYLEAAMTGLGTFAGLVQLATAVAGLVGMTYGHVSFTASMTGVSVSK